MRQALNCRLSKVQYRRLLWARIPAVRAYPPAKTRRLPVSCWMPLFQSPGKARLEPQRLTRARRDPASNASRAKSKVRKEIALSYQPAKEDRNQAIRHRQYSGRLIPNSPLNRKRPFRSLPRRTSQDGFTPPRSSPANLRLPHLKRGAAKTAAAAMRFRLRKVFLQLILRSSSS